jgi:hypothetical protein
LTASCAALTLVCACSTTATSSSTAAGTPSASSAPSTGAQQTAQQVLPNGLHLVSQTPQGLLYVRPGANFSKYTQVKILECFVAMEKGWQEAHNEQIQDLDQYITDSDVQNIKNILATQFKQVFSQALTQAGYPVVDTTAPDVLLLRPALLNVQVTAPDLFSSNADNTFVRSAGSATLYLELWDPVTKTILARAINSQADSQANGQVWAQSANFTSNREAADAILKHWADNLVKHLQAVRAQGGGVTASSQAALTPQ